MKFHEAWRKNNKKKRGKNYKSPVTHRIPVPSPGFFWNVHNVEMFYGYTVSIFYIYLMLSYILCIVVNQMTDLSDLKTLQKRPQHKSITDLKSGCSS